MAVVVVLAVRHLFAEGRRPDWQHVAPREERLVRRTLEDLLLKAEERSPSFAINSRHVDVEYAHQGVRLVLYASRFPRRRPPHPAGDAHVAEVATECQHICVHSWDVLEERCHAGFGSDAGPVLRDEYEASGSDEFLQRPSTGKPFAPPEGGPPVVRSAGAGYILQVGIAHLCM